METDYKEYSDEAVKTTAKGYAIRTYEDAFNNEAFAPDVSECIKHFTAGATECRDSLLPKLKERDARIGEMEAKMANTEDNLKAAMKVLKDRDDAISALESEVGELENDIRALEKTILELRGF